MRAMLSIGAIVAVGLSSAGNAGAGDWTGKGWEGRIFVTVGAGYQAAVKDFTYGDTQNDRDPFLPIEAIVSTAVTGKSATPLDLGYGVRVAGNFGLGTAYSRARFDETATLTLTVSSPLAPGVVLSGHQTLPVRREESALHLDAIYVVPIARHLNAILSAGPSRFTLKEQLVNDFDLGDDLLPDGTIPITKLKTQDAERSAWGFNAAVGLDYMFSKHVGIGALARYSHARVEITNPIDLGKLLQTADTNPPKNVEITLGGLQATGGLRIRF